YDVDAYRADFPILAEKIHGKPLVYLDNAGSTQRPAQVTQAMVQFEAHAYANIHRGVHELSVRATERYEAARQTVARFLNAASRDEIVFTRGGTEAINLVAASWGRSQLRAGDEIILTTLEHHSNIVPWQMVAGATGAVIRVAPINDVGEVTVEAIAGLLSPRTRMVAFAHVSNALGTLLPAQRIITAIRAYEKKDQPIRVLIDGCQAVARMPVDVRALDVDFYAFSGHKLYGPTGIGVLYGKKALLNTMPPYQTGGGMIASVSFEGTSFAPPPGRFEAGTPAITQAVGLAAAIDYVTGIGLDRIAHYEDTLVRYALQKLTHIDGLTIIGADAQRAGVISFVMKNAHPHDVGTILDRQGVAVRAGHHCAQPLMEHLGVPATARASFGLYNTHEEVDALAQALHKVQEIFA
ncbi:MAG: cysteine desulfurase, partial [Alphaproteobacteria bacterium]|nr:cysteine desulfurase [Alphaproteobacteria bacterium]